MGKVEVVRAAGLGLDDNAVKTVKGWTFQPATKGGKPIVVNVMVQVNFRYF